MAISKLSKLLTLIEESTGGYSIQLLARELEVSPAHVGSMLEYWVRKGRINPSPGTTECGSCSTREECPFVLEMPRTYELVSDQEYLPDQIPIDDCARHRGS